MPKEPKQMTPKSVYFSAQDLAAMASMSSETGLNQAQLVRQAVRLYQAVHIRAKDGQQMTFVKDGVLIPLNEPAVPYFPGNDYG